MSLDSDPQDAVEHIGFVLFILGIGLLVYSLAVEDNKRLHQPRRVDPCVRHEASCVRS